MLIHFICIFTNMFFSISYIHSLMLTPTHIHNYYNYFYDIFMYVYNFYKILHTLYFFIICTVL